MHGRPLILKGFGRCSQLVSVTHIEDNSGTSFCKSLRQGIADALRRAGNKRCLAFKTEQGVDIAHKCLLELGFVK